jgi:tetratricopeptide (TPR) repeat protein
VAIDRESTLRKAEKLLKLGRLDAAIAEYQRVVEDQPRDWNTINILGDLFVRAGQVESAVQQYLQIAQHFAREGFFQKAAALYKKVVRIKPDDEHALLRLADLSEQQGLPADAKTSLTVVAERRRRRGDLRGAAEIALRLARLDPADLAAGLDAARGAAELGDARGAAARFKAIGTDLLRRGRAPDGIEALTQAATLDSGDGEIRTLLLSACLDAGLIDRARQYAATGAELKAVAAALVAVGRDHDAGEMLSKALRLEPADAESRRRLARTYLADGEIDRAAACLGRLDVANADVQTILAHAELELRAGRPDEGRLLVRRALEADPSCGASVVALACSLGAGRVDVAFHCVEAVCDLAIAASDWLAAAAALRRFAAEVPSHVPALMKLVETCVDGGLDDTISAAQAQLADAYLASAAWTEARVIAEDLVSQEPWQRAHVERLRQALSMLGEPDPDRVIADRLSGESRVVGSDFWEETIDAGAPADEIEPVRTIAEEPRVSDDLMAADAAPSEVVAPAPRVADLLSEAPEVPPASEAGEVDLSAALDALRAGCDPLVSAPPEGGAVMMAGTNGDLERVFEMFRDEAAVRGLADAGAEHLRLAETYRDMGMVDECLKALEIAARSPRHRFDAASALAEAYCGLGRIPIAIEWYERAAEAPAPSVEAGRRLLYDLGVTLGQAGESERALAVFLELRADTPDYRDVAAWVRRLSAAL